MLLAVTTAFIIVASFIIIVDWLAHILMIKGDYIPYGYASYTKFKKEFDEIIWSIENVHSFGLWNRTSQSKFYSSLVMFKGKGMILNNPICWLRANIYARKHYRSLNNKTKLNSVKW